MAANYADVTQLVSRLFNGERVTEGDYGIKVTFGAGGSNVNKMLATVGRISTNEKVFHGDVEKAAEKFLELVPLESSLRHFERTVSAAQN